MKEFSPSFLYPYEKYAEIVSAPICRACIHQEFIPGTYPTCGKLKNPPREVMMGDVFKCDDFILDNNSPWKNIVLKTIKENT